MCFYHSHLLGDRPAGAFLSIDAEARPATSTSPVDASLDQGGVLDRPGSPKARDGVGASSQNAFAHTW
jgi:hypothetical protein